MGWCARIARAAGIVGVAFALGGCTYELHGPTTFAFSGLTEGDAKVVSQTLEAEGVEHRSEVRGDTTFFHTKGIRTTGQLGRVYRDVNRLRHRRDIEFEFAGLTMGYTSLTASGTVSTSIRVEVSPGALAFVADQRGSNPWRQIRLDSRGRWNGPVLTGGRVSQAGGWIYVAFTRDAKLFRFIRVNVLTGEQTASTLAEARSAGLKEPKLTPEAHQRNAGTPSGGAPQPSGTTKKAGWSFKWPWE